ncbi:Nramp family divalent metal transporter [Larsenimonas rhizosphaerae]|uniref:Divalent metal cation transporter MntH n=1 Tax=Larsenimonas rhizosphaerae TaxID=2944682 RepID=A0AA42CUX0_9GAMM|nr:Nramp family divalent metal transporter [Larsenimonas rhizosphaerae]MCM2129747.1 Nramp family divalent metal transporter [Larsenimonas rhizosphaerae]MCX2524406.1 Nramp family divalent metal transporter [Larsenimonas rhizosphaerae]
MSNDSSSDYLPGELSAMRAAQSALDGNKRGIKGLLPFLGPAFIASVAYIDPGNFATNIQAGSTYGYLLLWVVLVSNLMAILIQSMSAKLGIATGMNVPEVCRARFPRLVTWGLWVQAEIIAIATDLAEFIGGALGLHLLFGIDLFPAAVITGVFSFALLELQRRGFRPLEAGITALLGIVVVAFSYEVFVAKPDGAALLTGLTVPRFEGIDSVMLAAGILGATVMPHVIYLHSALTQRRVVGRSEEERKRIFRFEFIDILIAMGVAGFINGAMLVMAAGLFFGSDVTITTLEGAFARLDSHVGSLAAILFGVGLLASGFSSSSVGTMSGQVVMQGFLKISIPLYLRRLITMVPALGILAAGVDPTTALVMSQVVLSFGIPFALIPLLLFCSNRALMGSLVNHRLTTLAAWTIATVIIALNVFLLQQTLF